MTEYYLIDSNGDKRRKVKSLTGQEVKEITDACAAIYEFEYLDRRYLEIQLNYNEFQRVYTHSADTAINLADYQLKDPHFSRIFVDINRTFSNYVSSYKLFVDHFDQRLLAKYSESSSEYSAFKKHKSYIYDHNISYKLLYYLRNFSEHRDFPINHMQVDTDYTNGEHKKQFVISFDKNQLLKDKTIRSKMTLDLRNFGDLFPAMPYIEKTQPLLKSFYKVYLEIENNFLFKNIAILEKHLSYLKESSEPSFGYFVETGPSSRAFYTTIFPVDIILKLKTNYEKVVNGN